MSESKKYVASKSEGTDRMQERESQKKIRKVSSTCVLVTSLRNDWEDWGSSAAVPDWEIPGTAEFSLYG